MFVTFGGTYVHTLHIVHAVRAEHIVHSDCTNCTVHTVHTVRPVHIVHTIHIVYTVPYRTVHCLVSCMMYGLQNKNVQRNLEHIWVLSYSILWT